MNRTADLALAQNTWVESWDVLNEVIASSVGGTGADINQGNWRNHLRAPEPDLSLDNDRSRWMQVIGSAAYPGDCFIRIAFYTARRTADEIEARTSRRIVLYYIEHWKYLSRSKKWKQECSVCDCVNTTDIVGAHIERPGIASERIVPMCKSCNGKKSESFFLKCGTVVVLADPEKTCGADPSQSPIIRIKSTIVDYEYDAENLSASESGAFFYD